VNASKDTTVPRKDLFSRGQKILRRIPSKEFRAASDARLDGGCGDFFFGRFFASEIALFSEKCRRSRDIASLFRFNSTPEGVVGYARFASAWTAARFAAASERVARGSDAARVRADREARFGGRMVVGRSWGEGKTRRGPRKNHDEIQRRNPTTKPERVSLRVLTAGLTRGTRARVSLRSDEDGDANAARVLLETTRLPELSSNDRGANNKKKEEKR
jgi:hypothetical protein